MSNEEIEPFPEINHHIEVEEVVPVARKTPLHELPKQARIDHEIAFIGKHHERIAKSIRIFWGHKDCIEFLEQLILKGGDGAGNSRVGFKLEVVAALMNLTSLHEVKKD